MYAEKLYLPVLVLNKNWNPIGTTPLHRAINLLISCNKNKIKKAEVIDAYSVPFTWEEWSKTKPCSERKTIHSVSGSFRIPEIIKLNDYEKLKTFKVVFSRANLFKRDQYKCQYCGEKPGTEELSIDHIIPKFLGGKTTWENCVICCVCCNTLKANKLMQNVINDKFPSGMKLMKKPKMPNHNDIKFKVKYKSWLQWINTFYWNIELENDLD
jgi:5-methylcytosine-specific restriction endonuclease McrA